MHAVVMCPRRTAITADTENRNARICASYHTAPTSETGSMALPRQKSTLHAAHSHLYSHPERRSSDKISAAAIMM